MLLDWMPLDALTCWPAVDSVNTTVGLLVAPLKFGWEGKTRQASLLQRDVH